MFWSAIPVKALRYLREVARVFHNVQDMSCGCENDDEVVDATTVVCR